MAALGKVSEGPHSSTDCQLLDLQVAGLQGFANTLGPKGGGMAGNRTWVSCLKAAALHFGLLTMPVTINQDPLTYDP